MNMTITGVILGVLAGFVLFGCGFLMVFAFRVFLNPPVTDAPEPEPQPLLDAHDRANRLNTVYPDPDLKLTTTKMIEIADQVRAGKQANIEAKLAKHRKMR